jgi:hypothetical protein
MRRPDRRRADAMQGHATTDWHGPALKTVTHIARRMQAFSPLNRGWAATYGDSETTGLTTLKYPTAS